MLARISSRLLRGLEKHGLLPAAPKGVSILAGGSWKRDESAVRMDEISRAYEDSFQRPGEDVDRAGLPSVEVLRDAIEDLCEGLQLERIVLLMDEAAHAFRPEQQRQFFTLFRDLRSSQLSCNAAVYPGVTSYGETFQPAHDASFISLNREILDSDYVGQMREIVTRQATSDLVADIARNTQNFEVLAFAAAGNPRLLLKTVAKAPRLTATQFNEVIKSFYRNDLWAEHSGLSEKYPKHVPLIDWGRNFIEMVVLPELKRRNDESADSKHGEADMTCFFWIHKDAPAVIKEALRLLEYTGIVHEHTRGIRATRSEVGTRYAVNLGCLFALEVVPRDTGFQIAKRLGARRFAEYGANHPAYRELLDVMPAFVEPDAFDVLQRQMEKDIEVLDITDWQKSELKKIGLGTIGGVLQADEHGLQAIKYVGEKRSRRMFNAAVSAVLEYVSG
jgi:hypothetical protein